MGGGWVSVSLGGLWLTLQRPEQDCGGRGEVGMHFSPSSRVQMQRFRGSPQMELGDQEGWQELAEFR